MTRKFKCSDLSLLVAALTVAESYEKEKAAFVAESSKWEDPYIDEFKAIVGSLLADVYGINTKGSLEDTTKEVNKLVKAAKDDLEMVKTQIVRGFRTNPEMKDLLLKKLGFKALWRKASQNMQEAVLALMVTFSNNLTDSFRADMEAKGASSVRIDRIMGNGNLLNQANISQEELKGSTKEDTEQVVLKFNNIYEEVMDICVIGQKLFKNDKLKKAKFVFSKLIANQGASSKTGTEVAEVPAE